MTIGRPFVSCVQGVVPDFQAVIQYLMNMYDR